LIPLPDIKEFINKERKSRTNFIKKLHEKVKNQIKEQIERYTKYNNKEEKQLFLR